MEEKETGRLEAFSDGVFAVAITLLVLNIKIPGLDTPKNLPGDQQLWQALRDEWPMLAAYVTSFSTIGIMWINHHRLFTHIKRTNTVLLLLNLSLLLVIVFIPVPTALLSEYLPYPDAHAAAVVYCGTFLLMACSFYLLWFYASHNNRLLGNNVDANSVAAISRQYVFGPVSYLIIFVVSWFNTPTCIILSFILVLFFAIPGPSLRLIPQIVETKDEAKDIEEVQLQENM